ncbi:MAG: transposase, partial [Ketobacter sp.]|nr:transposase [Ketobacter sp.]
LQSMGVDAVFQQHASRKSDFRRGQRLGIKDHLITWTKPARPDWMDETTYLAMPETLTVREIKSGGKVIVTTIVDPKEATRKEIAKLYTQRWLVEVDLRSIKETLQMDVLRCKTPVMVRKEISVHFIAYNLIRSVMAQAAFRAGISPRSISFKGTIQTLNEFRSKIELVNEEMLPSVFEALIHAVAGHRVGHRPGRSEPRAVKRRPKSHPLLTVPRPQAA